MYKKILGNLPFNPSLINQLSFYGNRLKSEASVRRIGVVFIVMTMLVQFIAAISPPQSSLAASSNDIINGGFKNNDEAFLHCINTSGEDFGNIIKAYGATCDAVRSAPIITFNSTDKPFGFEFYSMGRRPQGQINPNTGKPTDETTINIPGLAPLYLRRLASWDNGSPSTYKALQIKVSTTDVFLVMFDCGNIVTLGKRQPPKPRVNPPKGYIDSATCDRIMGWAMDDDDPSSSISVHLYFDGPAGKGGKGWSIGLANKPSPDVKPGNHRYSVDLNNAPFDLRDGKPHTVYAYALNIGPNASNTLLNGSPRTFGPCHKQVSDKCPNIPGNQSDESDCDVCPNTVGIQENTDQCDVCPNKEGVQLSTSDCDVCPNTVGIQENTDQCDVCPNKEGVQLSTSDCDVCPNTVGIQENTDQCDVCPNIPGEQSNANDCKSCKQSKDKLDTIACIDLSKTVSNDTKNISDANNATAAAGDVLTYTLSAKNEGKIASENFVVSENIGDILDYADVLDLHGGNWDKNTNVVSWPSLNIESSRNIKQMLTVKIKSPIPQTPISSSDMGTMNLVMTNVYGNTVSVKLPATTPAKSVEIAATSLPNTGPGTSLVVGFLLTAVIGYFFARAKLYATEIEFVKREYSNSGGALYNE